MNYEEAVIKLSQLTADLSEKDLVMDDMRARIEYLGTTAGSQENFLTVAKLPGQRAFAEAALLAGNRDEGDD